MPVLDFRLTATDDQGRFQFDNLPAVTYKLVARKGGYVAAGYGATKIGSPGNPITLADGQHFVAKPIALIRGAVITGVVRNPKGRPMPGSQVQAVGFQIVDGIRKPPASGYAGTGSATADGDGVYRIYGLAPGDYLVSATAAFSRQAAGQELSAADFDWAEQQIRAPGAAATPISAVKLTPQKTVGLAATYFPGTADPASAGVVSVTKGEERTGVDIQMQSLGTARMSGVVMGLDGRPVAGATVVRTSKQTNRLLPGVTGSALGRTGADGTFTYSDVAPGEYTISARPAPSDGSPAGNASAALWGSADVTLNGDDVTGITVQLQPGMKVSGKIVFEGTTLRPPTDLSRVQPKLQFGSNASTVTINASPAAANADGTFTIDDVTPGSYRMTATIPGVPGAANNWMIKSATLNGTNVLDFPFDVQPGTDVSGFVITFTDRRTELTGKLIDAAGQAAPQFFVLAFSTDRKYWVYGMRLIAPARADVDGRFTITGLPPGEYYLCAMTEINNERLIDPTYLEGLIPQAIKITLGEGEKKSQDLRIGG